ncbi:MAG TPA: hypothetical protein G4O02_06735 [Caldilineae bacterium]|jgi:hypothetical protein|nr:hypothetical protein [Caldilineae bacterium]
MRSQWAKFRDEDALRLFMRLSPRDQMIVLTKLREACLEKRRSDQELEDAVVIWRKEDTT